MMKNQTIHWYNLRPSNTHWNHTSLSLRGRRIGRTLVRRVLKAWSITPSHHNPITLIETNKQQPTTNNQQSLFWPFFGSRNIISTLIFNWLLAKVAALRGNWENRRPTTQHPLIHGHRQQRPRHLNGDRKKRRKRTSTLKVCNIVCNLDLMIVYN